MNKLTTPLLLASAFVFLTGAHGGCGHHDPAKRAARMERMAVSHVEDVLDEIDATDAQKLRILDHTKRLAKDALVLHREHQGTKTFLSTEWKSDKPDTARVHSVIDERMSALTAFLHRAADALIDTHQTLSSGQRKALMEELH